MEISQVVVRIAFVALPGIIGSKVYRKLRGKTEKKAWEDFVEILIFCVLSYALYGLTQDRLVSLLPEWVGLKSSFTAVDEILAKGALPQFQDIVLASFVGVLFGYIASYVYKYKIINRMAQWIRATNRYGDEDVWEYFHNSRKIQEATWVFVRDHKLNLIYFGAVEVFSDSGKQRELVLTEVDVYDDERKSNLLYSVPIMYLSREPDDFTMQVVAPAPVNSRDTKEKEHCDGQERPACQDHQNNH